MAFVSTEAHGSLVVVHVDRPPANAMDLALLNELCDVLAEVASAQASAVVLAGRPGYFSAGADLKAMPGYGPEEQAAMVRGINRMAICAYGLEMPLVAAVTGHAIAGGMVLALCADYRVAAAEGRYGLTEVQVGVPYPQAAIGVVRSELGPGGARKLALTGRLSDAEECARLGCFDEVLEAGRVLGRALEVAAELGALPGDTYRRTKAGLRGEAIRAMKIAAEADPLLSAGG